MPWVLKTSMNLDVSVYLGVSVCMQVCSYSFVVVTPISKPQYAVGSEGESKFASEPNFGCECVHTGLLSHLRGDNLT